MRPSIYLADLTHKPCLRNLSANLGTTRGYPGRHKSPQSYTISTSTVSLGSPKMFAPEDLGPTVRVTAFTLTGVSSFVVAVRSVNRRRARMMEALIVVQILLSTMDRRSPQIVRLDNVRGVGTKHLSMEAIPARMMPSISNHFELY
jgi:hypothetical protein